MAEITGGELKYVVTIDTTQLDKALKDSEGKLKGFTEVAEQSGEKLDSVINTEALEMFKALGVESGKTGKEMKNALKEAEEFVKGMEGGMEVARGAVEEFRASLELIPEGIEKQELQKELLDVEVRFNEAANKTKVFREVLEDFKDENASLSSKLRDVKTEMEQLDAMGQRNSRKYQELSEKAQEYGESIKRVNDEVRVLSGGGGMQTFLSVMNTASSIATVTAGAYGLLADESKKIELLNQKIASVISIAIGIQQAQMNLTQAQTTVTLAAAKAKEVFAVASTRLATALNISTVAARTFLGVVSGGLLIALPFVVSWLSQVVEKQREAAKAQNELKDAMSAGRIAAAEEISQLKILYAAATDVTLSTKEREQAVKDLQKSFPIHFGNIDKEVIMNGKAKQSYDDLTNSIIAASRARGLEKIMAERQEALFKTQEELRKKRDAFIKDMKAATDKTIETDEKTIFISGDKIREANRKKAIEMEAAAMQAELNFNKENKILISEINRLKEKGRIKFDEEKTPTTKARAASVPKSIIPKPTVTKPEKPEEVLLEGSLAALRKELSEIQNDFEKTNDGLLRDILNTRKEIISGQIQLIEDKYKAEEDYSVKMKNQLQEFLEQHLSYEEQKTKITDKYRALRTYATPEQRDVINKVEKEELSKLAMDEFKKSEAWLSAFGDVTKMGTKQLKDILAKLKQELKNNAENLTASDLKTLTDQIDKMEKELETSNPFTILKKAIEEYIKKVKEGETATQEFKLVAASVAEVAGIITAGLDAAVSISEDLGINLSDGTKDAVQNISTVVGGVGDIAAGLASGNVAGVIKGIAGVVKGISNIFSGDQKKERNIKQWAAEVANLKNQYDQLNRAINKALGEDSYKASQATINNLRQQQAMIERMMKTEQSKKKADRNKIADFKKEMTNIDNEIEDIIASMTTKILQTDAKDLAASLGDALVEAFARGEDAALAMEDATNNIFKSMVKNAMKMQLEKQMQPILDDLLKMAGFDSQGNGTWDGLTQDEMNIIRERLRAVGDASRGFLDNYSDLFKALDPTAAQGMKGDIKGVTERTAGALESQINAMRIMQAEHGNIFRQLLIELVKIEINTRNLHEMRKDLAELNQKTKNGLAGIN